MKTGIIITAIAVVLTSTTSLLPFGMINKTPNQVFIGARPMAMGETFVAVADDINAIFWNPAGLPTLDHLGVNSMHANLFQSDVGLDYLALAIPTPYRTSLGIDWSNIAFSDEELEFSNNKFNFSLGCQLLDWLSLGLNIKHIQMTALLDKESEGQYRGWGFDWGVLFRPGARLKLGLMYHDFTNTTLTGIMGPVYQRNLRMGAGYQLFDNLIVAADLDDRLHLGSEWWPLARYVAVRAGIQQDFYTDEPLTFSFGIGLDLPFWGQRLRFDYAFTDTPTLLNTNRYSLSFLIDLFPRLVKINRIDMKPVYASLYKYYEDNPPGIVDIEYNGKKDLECSISVDVNKYAHERTKNIVLQGHPVPDFIQQVSINPAFNDSILSEPDNVPLIADVKISYLSGHRPREERVSQKFNLYRMNKIDWQFGAEQAAAFITPEDPGVVQFVRTALQQDKTIPREMLINEQITRCARLFYAVASGGIRYQEDSMTPYSSSYASLDNILYPAQLLEEKHGDCDDLTVLFASLFENRNIATTLVSVPGHIFLLFNSGLHPKQSYRLCLPDDQYCVFQDRIWLPLEVTWVHTSFCQAWHEGARQFNNYSEDILELINVREAWQRYKPVAFAFPNPKSLWNVPQDLARDKTHIDTVRQKYLSDLEETLKQIPDSVQLRNQLGILYANQTGIEHYIEKAEHHFRQVLRIDSTNSHAFNNIGNLFFMKGLLDSAELYYLEAEKNADGREKDGILLNLGLVYAAKDFDNMAVDQFARVMEDSNNCQRITDLLGIAIAEDELTKGDIQPGKIKISITTIKNLIIKASKNDTKGKKKKREQLKPIGGKGTLPEHEIENVFYWGE